MITTHHTTDMTQAELDQILKAHRQWIEGSSDGVRANLSDASLSFANLSDASLSGANLSGASLSGANLSGANLSFANLSFANLSDASLSFASLSGANLSGANLSDASLSDASLSGASLRGAKGLPIVPDSHQRLRAVASEVLAFPNRLQMGVWHGDCGTAHCVAGWAIHHAGPIGEVLEKLHGPHMAGLLLLGVDAAEHFYDSNDDAIAWLQSVAQEAA